MKKPTKRLDQEQAIATDRPASGPTYSAPALEKGLDILEMLCRSNISLTQTDIAENLGRSVSEIYRMLTCLVHRNYVVNVGDTYTITTKLFELAHSNPPTDRLLAEAGPIMQELSSDLQQACHMTVYNQGRQIVIAKVDNPSGMGFSIRVGADLDVLVSASGRVLLAFQDPETTELRIRESVRQRPDHAVSDMESTLQAVRKRGFESIVSVQIKGLHAVSYPILDTRGRALAALTVPYAERLDQIGRKTIRDLEGALGKAARALSERMGWRGDASQSQVLRATDASARLREASRRARRAASR
jgi:DNA-binding IclR family transcriptional regulator